GRLSCLPLGKPSGQFLQAAETAGRLRERRVAIHGRRGRGGIAGRQITTSGAQCREGWKARHGGRETLRGVRKSAFPDRLSTDFYDAGSLWLRRSSAPHH